MNWVYLFSTSPFVASFTEQQRHEHPLISVGRIPFNLRLILQQTLSAELAELGLDKLSAT
jgi:hypothetical protein